MAKKVEIMEMTKRRPVWAEIDLDALVGNIREIRRLTRPGALVTAVIKADAYGCGAVAVAELLLKNGADRLAVSVLDEAVELRRAGITAPILILGPTGGERAAELVAYDIQPCVFHEDDAAAFSREALRQGRLVPIHIGVDSGMGRIGFQPGEESLQAVKRIAALPGLTMEGIFTHFCVADRQDQSFTHEQYRRFHDFCMRLQEEHVAIRLHHCCNSAALLELPAYHWDMVRAGIILYGFAPSVEINIAQTALKPVISLKCRVSHVKMVNTGDSVSYGRCFIAARPARIASLPVGYADGYSRLLSGKVSVLVHGRRVPQVGRICMDQCMIDVTDIPDVQIGDEVVLFGRQGQEGIPVEELAQVMGTITQDVTCGIGRRVPRVYVGQGREPWRREYLFE